MARDVRREAAFRAVGLEYFTVLSRVTGPTGTSWSSRMAATRRRARFADPSESARWTTEPPPWWIPTETVEQRRALTAVQRARLLGRRTA